MSLPVNNKKNAGKGGAKKTQNAASSKFIKGGSASAKPAAGKKIRSTGANRGS